MNYYPVMDRQTESDAYEPTVQYAQVGSINGPLVFIYILQESMQRQKW